METSSFSIERDSIGLNEPIGEKKNQGVHSLYLSWLNSMASNPEFRQVVNYTDLEILLECPLCLDRFDQPRKIIFLFN